MIDDIIKSIRASLYERTTSPLSGSFSISWVIWNYRFILVLFSSMSVQDKLNYIEQSLYGDPIYRWLFLIIGPLATAGFFLFIYPYPAKWVYKFWRKRQKELKEIRQEIEDDTPLTIEESRKLRRQMMDLENEYDEELRRRSEEGELLKRSLVGSKETEGQLREEISGRNRKIAEIETILKGYERKQTQGQIPHIKTNVTDDDLKSFLLGRQFRLIFNPNHKQGHKKIAFGPNGEITEGMNQNENSWRIANGRLELVQSDGEVHSRFVYLPESNIFMNTNDPDTPSTRGQYMLPE